MYVCSQHVYRGQKTGPKSQFSPATLWELVTVIRLLSSGLVVLTLSVHSKVFLAITSYPQLIKMSHESYHATDP